MMVALAVAFQAATYGILMYSFTFWVDPWMTEFETNRSRVMAVISAHTIAMGIAAVFLGRWIDRIKARLALTIGLICLCCGLAIISIVNNIWLIMAVYVVIMPFAAVFAGPLMAMSLIARNVRSRQGLAFGITSMGTSIGGVAFPFIVTSLTTSIGWRETHLWLAVAIALLLIPIGWIILSFEQYEPRKSTSTAAQSRSETLSIIKTRHFWILSVSYFAIALVFSGLQFNLRPFASDLGLTVEQTAMIASSIALAMVVGKLGTGLLMDHFDNRVLFAGGATLLAGAVTLIMLGASFESMIVGFSLLGAGSGAFLPLKGALFSQAFGAASIGRAMGLAQPIITLYALSPLLGGWLRDATGSYAPFLIIVLGVSLLTIPLIIAGPNSRRPRPAIQ
ncbi:MFS transporter [Henriciella sp. AS95]|uniref:MFS transporter n=1 Tax=Henriciella sp. AS95 TaxID=3135782 RepID=UPI0031723D25